MLIELSGRAGAPGGPRAQAPNPRIPRTRGSHAATPASHPRPLGDFCSPHIGAFHRRFPPPAGFARTRLRLRGGARRSAGNARCREGDFQPGVPNAHSRNGAAIYFAVDSGFSEPSGLTLRASAPHPALQRALKQTGFFVKEEGYEMVKKIKVAFWLNLWVFEWAKGNLGTLFCRRK